MGKRRLLALADESECAFNHVQALIELLIGDHQWNQDADNVVEGARRNRNQTVLVAILRNFLGFLCGGFTRFTRTLYAVARFVARSAKERRARVSWLSSPFQRASGESRS